MNLRTSKAALLLGLINGILFYLAYQPVKIAYVKYLESFKTYEFYYVIYPTIYRIARDAGELFVWGLLFTVASYTAHRLWASRLHSTVSLWLRVGIIAMSVPICGLWFLNFLQFLIALAIKPFGGTVGLFPRNSSILETALYFVREPLDIKFEILLFTLALVVNLFYGAALSKLSKSFAKLCVLHKEKSASKNKHWRAHPI